jgi:citryl-CoA lyase
MKWKTSIAKSSPDETLIRGYKLEDLIGNLTFSEMIFLVLKGELPSDSEAKMTDALLVACTEHGINPPSITSARIAFSGGNPVSAGVAAGVLGIGDHHGGAIEQCAKLLQENNEKSSEELVKKFREEKKRMPGFGHKIYTTDPRTQELFALAKKYNIYGKNCAFAEQLEKALEKSMGRKLCLNVDGAVAAIMSDMGFDWRLGKGFFIIPRVASIIAHLHEEWLREEPFRRLDESEVVYEGAQKRPLPEKFRRK